ncbi:MAG: hypothetical protein ACFFAQ_11895 [Promethearchaeota archaeon]
MKDQIKNMVNYVKSLPKDLILGIISIAVGTPFLIYFLIESIDYYSEHNNFPDRFFSYSGYLLIYSIWRIVSTLLLIFIGVYYINKHKGDFHVR